MRSQITVWSPNTVQRESDFEKEVVGKMPGAAVFSSIQFQEYNEGEVNTKHTHKKREISLPISICVTLKATQKAAC